MPGSRRTERVSDLLREVAAEIIRTIKDPLVGDSLVSIVRVDVTPDLSSARFQVSVLGEPDRQKQVLEGLNRAAGYIRHEIKQQVHMKRVPAVVFELDQSMAYGMRMNELFRQVRQSQPEAEV